MCPQCLASLYNKARDPKATESHVDSINHGIAFAGLASYIEEVHIDSLVIINGLGQSLSCEAGTVGTHTAGCIHSTKLKNGLLSYISDMDAHKQGRDVVLICNEDICTALKKACEGDTDMDAIYLAEAAKLVRRDLLKIKSEFTGSYEECHENSVPVSLLALVSMVVYGTNITTQTSSANMPQAALSLSQLLMYNYLVNQSKASTTTKHSQARETPLPMYLGIMLHSKTRKRALHIIWDCAFLTIGYWTYLQSWGTRFAITMKWKRLFVLPNSTSTLP